MCDFENGFIFCTCLPKNLQPTVHHKNSRRQKRKLATETEKNKEYRWVLTKFVTNFEAMMEGICAIPSHDIGAGLTVDWVLLHLNCEVCFDFAYKPEEGDCLTIYASKGYDFLSFLFNNGTWKEGRHDCFSTISEEIYEGKLKPLSA